MSRVGALAGSSLLYRILLVVGLSLALSAIAANFWGVKLDSSWSGYVAQGEGEGVLLAAISTSGSGRVTASVSGVAEAYYIKLTGAPFRIFDYLSALNVSLADRSLSPDVRAGITYGWGVIEANPLIIRLLPAISDVTPIEVINSTFTLETGLDVGESIAIFIVAGEEGVVNFEFQFRVTGYARTSEETVLGAGMALALAGITGLAIRRLRS